ncbi:hypothetical protein KKA15_05130 [Patescibacteria group bacterium]|nr:hypothetical protein [Patescibacteria group bacterium]
MPWRTMALPDQSNFDLDITSVNEPVNGINLVDEVPTSLSILIADPEEPDDAEFLSKIVKRIRERKLAPEKSTMPRSEQSILRSHRRARNSKKRKRRARKKANR